MSNGKKTFIYAGSFSGKAKESGKPFNKISLVGMTNNGVRTFECFTDGGKELPNQKELQFGDVVIPEYEESIYPGGRPSLGGLQIVSKTPYDLQNMCLEANVAEVLDLVK